jgi:hypothetical protein
VLPHAAIAMSWTSDFTEDSASTSSTDRRTACFSNDRYDRPKYAPPSLTPMRSNIAITFPARLAVAKHAPLARRLSPSAICAAKIHRRRTASIALNLSQSTVGLQPSIQDSAGL